MRQPMPPKVWIIVLCLNERLDVGDKIAGLISHELGIPVESVDWRVLSSHLGLEVPWKNWQIDGLYAHAAMLQYLCGVINRTQIGLSALRIMVTDVGLQPERGNRYMLYGISEAIDPRGAVVSSAALSPNYSDGIIYDVDSGEMLTHRLSAVCLRVLALMLGINVCKEETCYLAETLYAVRCLDRMRGFCTFHRQEVQLAIGRFEASSTAASMWPMPSSVATQAETQSLTKGYDDFEVLVDAKAKGSYKATVIESPAGEGSSTMSLATRLSDLQETVSAIEADRVDEQILREFGEILFRSLFADQVEDLYRDSFGRADASGRGLRIRLRLNPPELATLPWEYLYDERHDLFLSISSRTPLSRYIQISEPIRPLSMSLPLKALVVISSPKDAPALDVNKERDLIRKALACDGSDRFVCLEFLEGAVLGDIRQALRRFSPHVFHFIGHGVFVQDAGYLLCEDEAGHSRLVDDQVFRDLFLGSGETRVVILNACEGAMSSSTRPLAGLAPNLVRRGIPAVIAMQYEISDSAAITFSSEFYRSIAVGLPIDVAVCEARRAIRMEFGADSRSWGTPALFMRSKDGVLFAQS